MRKEKCFKTDNRTTMAEYVEYYITNYPETRDNDELLYYMICKDIDPKVDELKWADVLLKRTSITIPSQSSVSRARRKFVEQHKEAC